MGSTPTKKGQLPTLKTISSPEDSPALTTLEASLMAESRRLGVVERLAARSYWWCPVTMPTVFLIVVALCLLGVSCLLRYLRFKRWQKYHLPRYSCELNR